MSNDPDEIVTLNVIAHDGAKLEIEMPRWVFETIERGDIPVWRGGGDVVLLMDDEGTVTRRYPMSDDTADPGAT
jgi:hypothetical protein